jgi:hypothetical protein
MIISCILVRYLKMFLFYTHFLTSIFRDFNKRVSVFLLMLLILLGNKLSSAHTSKLTILLNLNNAMSTLN